MKKKVENKSCPWSSTCPQIIKCMGYFLKAYAGVGIAIALFMLVGLQIEEQYRGIRNMDNCINHLSAGQAKLTEQEKNFACANIYRESASLFEYYRGNVLQFMPKDSFK